jgi:hypothetical protein
MASLKNLRPREPRYIENKVRHTICVTPTAWENLQKEALLRGTSVSELIELFARKALSVEDYKKFLKRG